MKFFALLRTLSFVAVATLFSCLGFFAATAAEAAEPAQAHASGWHSIGR